MGTVDDYLDELAPGDRSAIEKVYAIARDEVPEAEQGKGYGMPALVYRGKPLISVMRAKKHIGIYPFSPAAVSAVADAVGAVPGTGLDKGTVRFQPTDPLPDDIVRALVLARRQQIDG
ncbi:iron chaperone [Microbacterium sp. B2969]|uniref:Iron chaperone n=1 Tax=Microbacterium alkaliflavum TaxID=3248839 RepID=A0ABW7Q399_9MICO